MFMLASLRRGKESGKWKNVLVNFGTSENQNITYELKASSWKQYRNMEMSDIILSE